MGKAFLTVVIFVFHIGKDLTRLLALSRWVLKVFCFF